MLEATIVNERLRRAGIAAGAVALVAVVALGTWQWYWDMSALESWVEDHAVLGAASYIADLGASVVLMPLSSLALIPLAARVYGVLTTAVLSSVGWWIGALAAFQLARWGRHYLERITTGANSHARCADDDDGTALGPFAVGRGIRRLSSISAAGLTSTDLKEAPDGGIGTHRTRS